MSEIASLAAARSKTPTATIEADLSMLRASMQQQAVLMSQMHTLLVELGQQVGDLRHKVAELAKVR